MSQQQYPYQGGPQQGGNWNPQEQGYNNQNQGQYNNNMNQGQYGNNNQNQGQYNNNNQNQNQQGQHNNNNHNQWQNNNNNQNGGNQGQYNNNQPPQYNDQNDGDYYDQEWGENEWNYDDYGASKGARGAGGGAGGAGAAGAAGAGAAGTAGVASAKAVAAWSTGAIVMIAVASTLGGAAVVTGATLGILAGTTEIFSSSSSSQSDSAEWDFSLGSLSDDMSDEKKAELLLKVQKKLKTAQKTLTQKAKVKKALTRSDLQQNLRAKAKAKALPLRKYLSEVHKIEFVNENSWEVKAGKLENDDVSGLVLLVKRGYTSNALNVTELGELNDGNFELAFCEKDEQVDKANAGQREFDDVGMDEPEEARIEEDHSINEESRISGVKSNDSPASVATDKKEKTTNGTTTSKKRVSAGVKALFEKKEKEDAESNAGTADVVPATHAKSPAVAKKEDDEHWAKQAEKQAMLKKMYVDHSMEPEVFATMEKYLFSTEDAQDSVEHYAKLTLDENCKRVDDVSDGDKKDEILPIKVEKILCKPFGATDFSAVPHTNRQSSIVNQCAGLTLNWYGESGRKSAIRVVHIAMEDLNVVRDFYKQFGCLTPFEVNPMHERMQMQMPMPREERIEYDDAPRGRAQRHDDYAEEAPRPKGGRMDWASQSAHQQQLKKKAEKVDDLSSEQLLGMCIPEEEANNAFKYYYDNFMKGKSDSLDNDALAMFHCPESTVSGAYKPYDREDDNYKDWVCYYKIDWEHKNSGEEDTRTVYLGPAEIKELVSKWNQAGRLPYPDKSKDDQQKQIDKRKCAEEEAQWVRQADMQKRLRLQDEKPTLTSVEEREITDVYAIAEEDADAAFSNYVDMLLSAKKKSQVPQKIAKMFHCPLDMKSASVRGPNAQEIHGISWAATPAYVEWKQPKGRTRKVYIGLSDLQEMVKMWKQGHRDVEYNIQYNEPVQRAQRAEPMNIKGSPPPEPDFLAPGPAY